MDCKAFELFAPSEYIRRSSQIGRDYLDEEGFIEIVVYEFYNFMAQGYVGQSRIRGDPL